MLSEGRLCVDASSGTVAGGNLSLAESFSDPTLMVTARPEALLHGLCTQQCQEIDDEIDGWVRNFLFGAPGSGGSDLVSPNIQRGRDHGLPLVLVFGGINYGTCGMVIASGPRITCTQR